MEPDNKQEGLFNGPQPQDTANTTAETPKKTEIAVIEKNISDSVLKRIEAFQAEGSLKLPADYSPENALKSAFLYLDQAKDKNNNPVLSVCTKNSVATALLDMVVQGLSVSKKQCYFIAYGDNLTLSRSYFGTVALARRVGGIVGEPVANVIYKGDEFAFEIDAKTGRKHLVKHVPKLENIGTEIVGAYCILNLPGGEQHLEIMSMNQIRASWAQGATKGSSPAHRNFEDQMALKTVIGRACKMFINSSSDGYLYEHTKDESDSDPAKEQRDAARKTQGGDVEEISFEEVRTGDPQPAPAQKKSEGKTEKGTKGPDW